MTEPKIPQLEDRRLAETMKVLDPSPAQVERMEDAILASLAASRGSLAREWIDLFRVRPVMSAALAAAAAVVFLLTTPLGSAAMLLF